MKTTLAFLFASVFALAACSSSSSGNGASQDGGSSTSSSPTSCTGADECNPDQCTCNDGQAFASATICANHTCSTASDTLCPTLCQGHGGLKSIAPAPNVASSPECDAYCAKGASLQCGGASKCNRFFFCGIGKGDCEASARAALDCAVKQGDWACNSNKGWGVSSSCGTFRNLCGASDAGSD